MDKSQVHSRSSSMSLVTGTTAGAIQKIRSISITNTGTLLRPSNMGTRRTDAMHKLLSSERTYVDDLALVCGIHIPLAQGKPVHIPSSCTVSPIPQAGPSPISSVNTSSSSTSPSKARPSPMTTKDVEIIFRNIGDIASFSSRLIERLEAAVNCVSNEGGSGEDKVGELFLEIIPELEYLYKTYLKTHSKALTHLQQLLLSPACWSYPSDVRSHLSFGTRIPDLPSLLMKPERRIPEYRDLLSSLIDATPASYSNVTALASARFQMKILARDIENNGKVMPFVPRGKTSSISNGTTTTIAANKLAQLESRLDDYLSLLDRLGEEVKVWVIATRHSAKSLHEWGIAYGAMFGLAPSTSAPYRSGYDAFIGSSSSLPRLCTSLEDDLQTTFKPLLHQLKTMAERSKRRLNEMHSLELSRAPPSPLARLWRPDTFKSHPRRLSLQSELSSQLPSLLSAMDRAVILAVRILVQRQIAFFKAVEEMWYKLFDSLKVMGERYGGTEETLRAWQARWEVGLQKLSIWEEGYMSGESTMEGIHSSAQSETNLPARLSAMSTELPPVDDIPSGSPPKLRMRFSFPPSSRASARTRQSAVGDAFILYTIRASQPYSPPPHGPYRGYAFFKLIEGDGFDVLEEYDHPSVHADLPRCFVSKRDKDCLLKVRARNTGTGHAAGDVGWVLARFVSAD